jgi:hypothetical protein
VVVTTRTTRSRRAPRDSILVAAVTGRKVRVHAFVINQGDTTPSTVTFNTKPAGAGSAIFAPLKYAANGGYDVDGTVDGVV